MTLSVLILDREPPQVLARCLASLDQLSSKHLVEVTVFRQERCESLGQARARAAAGAKGEFLVLLNPRYRVVSEWATAMLEAHAAGAAVVGGPVCPLEGLHHGFDCRRAIYLWEYVQTAPPIEAGEVAPGQAHLLPGGNTSYRTELLNRYGFARYGSEMEIHSAMAAAGVRICRNPVAVAVVESPEAIVCARELFRDAREYSAAKSGNFGARAGQALARVILLPGWLFLKGVVRVFRRPEYRSWLLASLPWFALFSLIRTAGEVAGYVHPPGRTKPSVA
ncbi:MAG TPA: hypothetical protein VG297_15470 [Bryobacteraceae bacterium]|nr:hypothetical protein [Bryobacteraceae bacterium]